jgi:hypothetical protein
VSIAEVVVQTWFKEITDEILDHLQKERAAAGLDAASQDSQVTLVLPPETSSVVTLTALVTQAQLDADTEDELPRWREFLEQQVSQFIKLVVEPDTFSLLGDALRGAVIKDKFVGNVALWYDIKTAGEASSNPNCRIPPFRAIHLKKMVQGFVNCRGSSEAGSPRCCCI